MFRKGLASAGPFSFPASHTDRSRAFLDTPSANGTVENCLVTLTSDTDGSFADAVKARIRVGEPKKAPDLPFPAW